MGHRFMEIAFTDEVKREQERHGSRANYARAEGGEPWADELGPDETAFLTARDSFYMASVGSSGWPYVQHRGGPPGFVKVLDPRTFGFADFRGNRQYVSVGNVRGDDRVATIFVDYPRRQRLKILGHARLVGEDEPELLARLRDPGYRARVERGWVITVAGFDWNCPQHITPRWTEAEIAAATQPLRDRVAELERELAALRKPAR